MLNNHWNKHSNEFPEEFSNKAEYFEYSINLLESSTSDTIPGHINRLGQIIRFDKEKNLFVKGSIEKGIFTMFRPKAGVKYYKIMKDKDIKNGGKI